MSNILITGGCGFIGSNLSLRLVRKGHKVTVLDKLTYAAINYDELLKESIQIKCGDINVIHGYYFNDSKFDCVINLAGETHVDNSLVSDSEFIHTNVTGAAAVAKYCLRNKIKLIHLSTDEVLGSATFDQTIPFNEEAPIKCSSPYSASKAGGELLIRSYMESFGLKAVILRCTNVIGPRQHPEKFVPKIITNALQDLPIPVYGEGNQLRAWLDVDYFCDAIELLLEKPESAGVYNLSPTEETDNLTLVRVILNLLDKPWSLITHVQDRPAHDVRYFIDSSKFRKEFGWSTGYSISSSALHTINWYRYKLGFNHE